MYLQKIFETTNKKSDFLLIEGALFGLVMGLFFESPIMSSSWGETLYFVLNPFIIIFLIFLPAIFGLLQLSIPWQRVPMIPIYIIFYSLLFFLFGKIYNSNRRFFWFLIGFYIICSAILGFHSITTFPC